MSTYLVLLLRLFSYEGFGGHRLGLDLLEKQRANVDYHIPTGSG